MTGVRLLHFTRSNQLLVDSASFRWRSLYQQIFTED